MRLYAAFDLHSRSSHLAILDQQSKRVFKDKLANHAGALIGALEPFKEAIAGVVVESTFNWYWLVDTLMEAGYRVHLANPAAIQKIQRTQALRRHQRCTLSGRDAAVGHSTRRLYLSSGRTANSGSAPEEGTLR